MDFTQRFELLKKFVSSVMVEQIYRNNEFTIRDTTPIEQNPPYYMLMHAYEFSNPSINKPDKWGTIKGRDTKVGMLEFRYWEKTKAPNYTFNDWLKSLARLKATDNGRIINPKEPAKFTIDIGYHNWNSETKEETPIIHVGTFE
jgi:hypothetical protein